MDLITRTRQRLRLQASTLRAHALGFGHALLDLKA